MNKALNYFWKAAVILALVWFGAAVLFALLHDPLQDDGLVECRKDVDACLNR